MAEKGEALYIEPMKNYNIRRIIFYIGIYPPPLLFIFIGIYGLYYSIDISRINIISISLLILFWGVGIGYLLILIYFWKENRFILYENGLFKANGRKFISYNDIKEINLNIGNTYVHLVITYHDKERTQFKWLPKSDYSTIKKIFKMKRNRLN